MHCARQCNIVLEPRHCVAERCHGFTRIRSRTHHAWASQGDRKAQRRHAVEVAQMKVLHLQTFTVRTMKNFLFSGQYINQRWRMLLSCLRRGAFVPYRRLWTCSVPRRNRPLAKPFQPVRYVRDFKLIGEGESIEGLLVKTVIGVCGKSFISRLLHSHMPSMNGILQEALSFRKCLTRKWCCEMKKTTDLSWTIFWKLITLLCRRTFPFIYFSVFLFFLFLSPCSVTHTHACTHMHPYTDRDKHARTHKGAHTRAHTHTHACAHTHTHTRVRAHTHTHTRARTHTHTRTRNFAVVAEIPACTFNEQ